MASYLVLLIEALSANSPLVLDFVSMGRSRSYQRDRRDTLIHTRAMM